jgi:hypothetical protein
VQDRSNPGPFTLPELFGAIELLSSEEKSAFGYERVIRISFTNTEQPWLESASQFTIKAYANWKSDLEQLLSSTGNWIYPIMIPTKVSPSSFAWGVGAGDSAEVMPTHLMLKMLRAATRTSRHTWSSLLLSRPPPPMRVIALT